MLNSLFSKRDTRGAKRRSKQTSLLLEQLESREMLTYTIGAACGCGGPEHTGTSEAQGMTSGESHWDRMQQRLAEQQESMLMSQLASRQAVNQFEELASSFALNGPIESETGRSLPIVNSSFAAGFSFNGDTISRGGKDGIVVATTIQDAWTGTTTPTSAKVDVHLPGGSSLYSAIIPIAPAGISSSSQLTLGGLLPADASSLPISRLQPQIDIVLQTGTTGNYTPISTLTDNPVDSGFVDLENRDNSVFGDGWTYDDYQFLVQEAGEVSWSYGGETARFTGNFGSGAVSEEVPGTLTLNGSSYTYDSGLGVTLSFDAVTVDPGHSDPKFMLTSRTDRYGNTTEFSYIDGDLDHIHDDLHKVTDPFGRETVFTYTTPYTGGYRLTKITDYAGRETDFEYYTSGPDQGFLKNYKLPEVDTTTGQDRPTTHYTYTGSGKLHTIKDPRGFVSEYFYDSNDRVIAMKDFDGSVYQQESAMGQVLGAVKLTSDVYATKLTQRGHNETRKLNMWGNEIEFQNGLGETTYTDRNDHGLVLGVRRDVSVGGTTTQANTTYQRNSSNHFILDSVTAPDATRIEYSDHNGIQLPETTQRVTGVGVDQEVYRDVRVDYSGDTAIVLSETVVMGGTFDGASLVDDLRTSYTHASFPVGNTNRPVGLVETVTDPNGNVTTYEYEENEAALHYGRLTKITHPQVGSEVAEKTFSYSITATGTVVTITDEDGRLYEHHYDALERLVKTKAPSPISKTALSTLTEYFYDLSGNLVKLVDAEQNVTEYEYDGKGRLTQITEADPDGPMGTDYQSPVTTFIYDAAGNLQSIKDPEGHVTRYHYDAANRMVALIEPDVDGQVANPHAVRQNPADIRDVNADGVADLEDRALIEELDGTLPSLNPHGIPTVQRNIHMLTPVVLTEVPAYADIDADGDVDEHDVTAWDAAVSAQNADVNGNPVTLYEYDPSGNLTFYTDANGNTTEYQYDVASRHTKTLLPQVNVGLSDTPSTPTTEYVYDEIGQLIQMTDADGGVTDYIYDDAGRLEYELWPDVRGTAPSNWQNPLHPFDVNRDGTVDQLDESKVNDWINDPSEPPQSDPASYPGTPQSGFILPTARPASEPSIDVTGNGALDHDDLNAIQAFRASGTVDSLLFNQRAVMRYVYDKGGRITSMVDPMFSTTEYLYDERDRLVAVIGGNLTGPKFEPRDPSATDPDITVIRSNNSGPNTDLHRPVVEYGYDVLNRQTLMIDTLGRTTTWTYDKLDQADTVTYPDPDANQINDVAQVAFDHDLVGNLIQETDPRGHVTTYVLDDLYRVESIQLPDVDPPGPYDPEFVGSIQQVTPTISFSYDDVGRVLTVEDPLGRLSETGYDSLGRVIQESSPDDTTVGLVSSILYVDYGYDLVGNVVAQGNHVTPDLTWQYDAANRVTSSTDQLQKVTSFQYDGRGNRISLTDPNSNKTWWVVDGLGRTAEETNALNQKNYFTHDFLGNLTSKKDGRGRVTVYGYDHAYRNTAERWYTNDSLGNLERTMTFGYDIAGRMTSSVDPDHNYSYDTYDDLDRLTQVTKTVGSLTSQTVELDFTYDRGSFRSTMLATIGGNLDFENAYDYDDLGRLQLITQKAAAGAANSVAFKAAHFGYNLASQQAEIKRYAGAETVDTTVATTTRTYDGAGRLDLLNHYKGHDPAAAHVHINGYDFGYDAANRITSMNMTQLIYQGESATYGYNGRDELTSATHSVQPSESYTFDDNGNRLTKDDPTTNLIGLNNELTADASTGFSFTYDAEGNRATRADSASTAWTEYEWDHRNRLTKVTDYATASPGSVTQTVVYRYDASNQLVAREVTETGQSTEYRFFVYDDGQILLQFDGTGSNSADLRHRYLWGPDVDQMIADEEVETLSSEGIVYWPLTDHLGTVRDIVKFTPVDTTVHLLHRQYDAFGNIIEENFRGDFNGDEQIDDLDIDYLFAHITSLDTNLDLNGDGLIDEADVDTLVEGIIQTVYGDATLDGNVDGQDFTAWVQNQFTSGNGWAQADYNGDGIVDGDDFLIWANNNFSGDSHVVTHLVDHMFGYTGRMLDDVTGLQNNLNRWYDAEVGRWISEDPISFAGGDANLYRYVGNTTTSYVDPTGLAVGGAAWGDEHGQVANIDVDVTLNPDGTYHVVCTLTHTRKNPSADDTGEFDQGDNFRLHAGNGTGKRQDEDADGVSPRGDKDGDGRNQKIWEMDVSAETQEILIEDALSNPGDGIAARWDKGENGEPTKPRLRRTGRYMKSHSFDFRAERIHKQETDAVNQRRRRPDGTGSTDQNEDRMQNYCELNPISHICPG